jgi:hypothetical protein
LFKAKEFYSKAGGMSSLIARWRIIEIPSYFVKFVI